MGAQPGPYQQFLDYMNAKSGRIFEIEFYQEQFGKRFESNGTFFYLGKKHYTFDALDQRITFNNGEITTINKVEKQVIYDQTIPGEVTIFDILTGTNKSLQTGEPLLEKNGFRIPFTLLDWEMHGTIRTIPGSGKPKEIILKTGDDSEIWIKIISLDSIKGRDVAAIDLTNYETIDLRE
jgi:hypothetical protein